MQISGYHQGQQAKNLQQKAEDMTAPSSLAPRQENP
jgi:hypothetical protein